MNKIYLLLFTIFLSSCAELTTIMESYPIDVPLSEAEVANGLKEALRVGTDSASAHLGVTDGYYGDDLVKIVLPEEANMIVDNLSKIPGGDKLVEDLILRINRAAEDAAKDAGPVFWKAVQEMTINDAFTVLKGEDDAATQYLKSNTYVELFDLYSPKIKASLDKEIVAGVSTTESWETLTGKWNRIADNTFAQMAGLKPVHTELPDYLTKQALSGLFIKIAEEEKHIRQDPKARVNDILKRVFE